MDDAGIRAAMKKWGEEHEIEDILYDMDYFYLVLPEEIQDGSDPAYSELESITYDTSNAIYFARDPVRAKAGRDRKAFHHVAAGDILLDRVSGCRCRGGGGRVWTGRSGAHLFCGFKPLCLRPHLFPVLHRAASGELLGDAFLFPGHLSAVQSAPREISSYRGLPVGNL